MKEIQMRRAKRERENRERGCTFRSHFGPIHITIRFNSAHWLVSQAMQVARGCPHLRRRCCLFGHSSDEVASASLVGMQLPVSGTAREEHEALVAAVRRLAAALMWSRGTVVEPVVAAAGEDFREDL